MAALVYAIAVQCLRSADPVLPGVPRTAVLRQGPVDMLDRRTGAPFPLSSHVVFDDPRCGAIDVILVLAGAQVRSLCPSDALAGFDDGSACSYTVCTTEAPAVPRYCCVQLPAGLCLNSPRDDSRGCGLTKAGTREEVWALPLRIGVVLFVSEGFRRWS